MITMSNPGPPIDESQISEIEKMIEAHLPSSYRSFLLRNNGGLPTPDVIDIDGLPGGESDIQVFFGIGRDFKTSELTWNFDITKYEISGRYVLPIASDSFGNLFCLDLTSESHGKVVYCDLMSEKIDFYEVASDFEAFLGKICDWPKD